MSRARSEDPRGEAATARRFAAIDLLATGTPQAEVARSVGVSRQAVHKWRQAYLRNMLARGKGGRRPKVSMATIAELLERACRKPSVFGMSSLWTLGEVVDLLGRELGIIMSISRAAVVLRELGYAHSGAAGWRKVVAVVDPESVPWG